jgi:hypothetical protein
MSTVITPQHHDRDMDGEHLKPSVTLATYFTDVSFAGAGE